MELRNPDLILSIDTSTTNGLLLYDRLIKITQIIEQYGEENFYMSYSGGKDSNVMHALFDMALPDNKIPRVYCDTGIELNAVRDFVKQKAVEDSRFVIIKSNVPIKKMLEDKGYPFKSKYHSKRVKEYTKNHEAPGARKYYQRENVWGERNCPLVLQYQFEREMSFKISDLCCNELKKEPIRAFLRKNKYKYSILGLMKDEGGERVRTQCLSFSGDDLKSFQPLAPLTKDWEDWFIAEYDIKLPIVYYPPYNFERTGCKGCPFALNLQQELDTLQTYFPNERKQCEAIWKPVYEEYRRIGYRLKPDDGQLSFADIEEK